MAASLKTSAYPALGISYAVSRQWLLTLVAGMMLKCLLIPIYWFSDSLVQHQHDRLYSDVLASKEITVSLGGTIVLNAGMCARILPATCCR